MAARLTRLRQLFTSPAVLPVGVERLHGYIIPSEDAHASEYIADCDCRRAFISGFTGSKGLAMVTETDAVMYTDGRYFLQAEGELFDGWTLMRMGQPETPSEEEWLRTSLPPGGAVGVDPSLLAGPRFRELSTTLEKSGRSLVAVDTNLVDRMWDDRPARPMDPVIRLDERYAGVSVTDKLHQVRGAMADKGQEALLLSSLDEVAWLLNLRGSDIVYNPVFFAYVLVTPHSATLYCEPEKLPAEVTDDKHFSAAVTVLGYSDFFDDLRGRDLRGPVWVGPTYSYAVAQALENAELLEDVTPVCTAKAVKNGVELDGMRGCHRRDAVALCEFFLWMEGEMAAGRRTTEWSAAVRLEQFRAEQEGYQTPSFATISSSGPSGAIIHYHPHEGCCRDVAIDALYLLDSGGQYLDGTTDVTRTVHFAAPTEYERECFTRVLKGHISLATLRFPKGTSGILIDAFARRSLWDAGLDYRHGTGHGVGSFLNVHEGPIGISSRASALKAALEPGMIVTIEPGYYEDEAFGIRIENVVEVVPEDEAKLAAASQTSFMAFRPCTLFPIQRKLVAVELLTDAELEWLNAYHTDVERAIAPLLGEQGRAEALAWLQESCQPICR